MKTTCFQCGKKLVKITNGPRRGELAFVVVDYHGTPVRMHDVCSRSFARRPFEPVVDPRREPDASGNYHTRPVGSYD